jgi:hypothetical protein
MKKLQIAGTKKQINNKSQIPNKFQITNLDIEALMFVIYLSFAIWNLVFV